MPLDISGSMGNISDAAAAAGAYPQNTVNTGIEQIYSPVVIRREGEGGAGIPTFEVQRPDGASRGAYAAGHLGATRRELDPYFSVYATGDSGDFMKECDYWHVRNYASGTNGEDLNPRKVNRGDISTVGVAHFRGPMILSGWGSDMGDRPVPHVGGDVFTADPEMLNNRGTWKAGPIALLWDRDRKVWSMGHHMVCGVATQSIRAPTTPCSPTYFNIKVFRDESQSSPPSLTAKKLGEIATITNRDISLTQDYVPDLIFVVAARINYEWLPVWVGCPEDCNAGDSECPTVDCA
jgi:hypothetical protein